MKLNKIFAMFMLVAALGMVACSEKNSPSGPGGGGQGGEQVVTIDTTKAISIADAIKKADSGEEVVIKGYVTFAYDMENGKQDAWIASTAGTSAGEIEAFKCEVTTAVAKGDYVAVRGKVVTYTKKDSGETIYEIADGVMQIIRKGTDTTPIVGSLEGDGTETKPYTVADVIALNSTKEGPAYIKGIIIGQVKAGGMSMKDDLELATPFTGNDSNQGTNIVIAAATGETNTAMMVPVRLPSGMREFSLPKDASMLGKEIIIYGKMQKYFGQAGIGEMLYAKIGEKTYGSKPVAITGNEKLYETLLTQASFDKFTVVNVSGDLTWVFDVKYGAKMSGYDTKTHANEDWFISPAFDATGGATLTFDHARGPKGSMNVSTDNYTVWVSNDFDGDVATATWTRVAIPTHGTTAWGYVNSGNMVIPDANCAANCRIAWKYVCNDSESATWEIKNVIVK